MLWYAIASCFLTIALAIAKKSTCKDKFDECKEHTDDCVNNPGFMAINCPKTCSTCHLRNPKVRCNPSFLNISTEPVLSAGAMDTMFTRLEEQCSYTVLSRDPWVVQIENFLSEDVVDTLLQQVTEWEQSAESGEVLASGSGTTLTTSTRTSSTFWCNLDCQKSAVSTQIRSKISEALQIPAIHFEPIQLLRYTSGQFYVPHHDYSFQELQLACGPRILTFFLYLSDVEDGGATYFPDLNITIRPKKGMAVLWPNTLSANPSMKDTRMTHEAQRVNRGVKYAANVWVHLYEWERPSLWACTGS